jgi:glycosidase
MFASRVASYNDNRLVGSDRTTATASFDRGSVLYRAIAALAAMRRADPALMSGEQVVRAAWDRAGLFAFSRLAPSGGGETLVAFNTSTSPVAAQVEVGAGAAAWTSVHGGCAGEASAPGSYRVEVPALDYVVCRATRR